MELPAADPNSVGLLRKRERTTMAGGLCATPRYRHCHSEYILDAPQGYLPFYPSTCFSVRSEATAITSISSTMGSSP